MRLLNILAATGLLLTVAACGPNNNNDTASAPAPGSSSAATDAFPVLVCHKSGTTEIKSEPKRIVTVGLVEQDALLALGIVPVGTTEWFGKHPSAVWPWAQDKLGGAKPELVGDGSTISFEKISALKPDLILALYAGLTEEHYKTLSQIAPVDRAPMNGDTYPGLEQISLIAVK